MYWLHKLQPLTDRKHGLIDQERPQILYNQTTDFVLLLGILSILTLILCYETTDCVLEGGGTQWE